MYHNNTRLSNHTIHIQQCVICVAGAGAAPQIGGKLAAEPWSSSALDASAAAAGPPVNHQVTLYQQSGPRWRGPVSLLMLGPAGAPCAPAVPWAHPWACAQHHGAPRRAHVAAEARSHKVPRFAGRAQRNPQTTPRNACWRVAHSATRQRHLRRRPVGLRAGLPLAQPAAQCKGKPRRWRGGDAALALSRSRCSIAAPGAQALSGSAPAAARGLSLAPPWWGQANRPCNGPGPFGPARII